MAMIKCPECGKDISEKAGVCPNCGTPIENTFCRFCGSKISAESVICPCCGRQVKELSSGSSGNGSIVINNNNNNNASSSAGASASSSAAASASSSSKKQSEGKLCNKWTAWILCVFFGLFGAHKFYEGKSGMGIVYLCTLGLCGIGWLIDIFAILGKPNPYQA